MKNQKLKIRKLNKAKARRKDFEKKKRIIDNRPSIKRSYKKPVFKQEVDRKGVVKVVQIGEKEVRYSIQIPKEKTGVFFPKSRKFKESKKKNVKKAK